MKTELVFGAGTIDVELPERTVFPSAGVATTLPATRDIEGALRSALDAPLDTRPLREIARPGARVTVAFDDPTVAQYAPVWSIALPVILGELERGGVKRSDVRLICANALHRKFTHVELATILGDDMVREFGPRLACHDAEDPDGIVDLGTTPNGFPVELNRAVRDSDLVVYLNCSTYRGFSGGWKSICVGLSTYRSIAVHHNPTDMSMSFDRNRMHEILSEMGAHVSARVGHERFFKVETVQASPLEVSTVLAGSIDATRVEAQRLIRGAQAPRRALIGEPVDIVVYGIPDWSPYAAFSHMNPLLTLVSTGLGYLGGVIEAFGRRGCSVILATPCPNRWDDARHPSYREVWDRVLAETRDPDEIRARYEREFATRGDYIDRYRNGFGFHGVHGVMAAFPLKRLGHAARVFVAGAEEPALARHLGFEFAPTVEAAIAAAESIHGAGATVACVRYPLAANRC